jgi:hypothetical protein
MLMQKIVVGYKVNEGYIYMHMQKVLLEDEEESRI